MRTLTSQREWVKQAACHDTVTNDIYDPFYDNQAGDEATAKAMCASCPVWHHCLTYAMATEHQSRRYGIWAGTTPKMRREIWTNRQMMNQFNFQGEFEVTDPTLSITELQEQALATLAGRNISPNGDVQFEFFYDVHERRQYLRLFFPTALDPEEEAA